MRQKLQKEDGKISMDDRSKSILLQVAFKESVAPGTTSEEVELRTVQLYEVLISLHEKLGINPTAPKGSGGYPAKRSSAPKSGATEGPVGESFIVEGEIFTDFRAVKADPKSGLNPNFPDFKRESDGKPYWLYSQDGEPKEETAPLVAAADQKAFS